MDPKLSGLDPKLREAYERVMNGPTAPADSTPPQNPTEQQPLPPSNPAAPAPQPYVPPTPTTAPAPSASPTSFNAANFQTSQGTTTNAIKRGGGKMSTVLIIVGLIFLLVAYTFVWVYLFHLKIPFLPAL